LMLGMFVTLCWCAPSTQWLNLNKLSVVVLAYLMVKTTSASSDFVTAYEHFNAPEWDGDPQEPVAVTSRRSGERDCKCLQQMTWAKVTKI
jgi:hypothetical protein